MALNDRNIVIVPNKGNSSVPVITFSGADETVSEQTINVKVYAANSGTLSFESWTAGQLFSISNDREPVVYGVNDISGIPLFQVFESGQVNLSQYFGNVQIGTTSPDGTSLLQVQGITKTNSLRITAYGEVIAANGRWMGPSSGLEGAQGIQGVQGVQGTSIQGIQGIQGSSGGGGGSPGGTTNQIQYNSGGALAGSANLTFTTSTGNVFAVGTSAFTANSTSGNVGIGVINPAAKLETRGYVICGDVESTSGAKLIRGYYSSGAITTLGSSRSSGGPVVGYAVEPNTTIEVSASGLISSTPAYLARSAYYLTGNTHYWFTGPHQTVLTGDPVTMYQKMVLANSGVTIYPGIIGATYGLTVSGGDITAARSATNGAIYLGTDGTHYLWFNGSNYIMPAGGLLMGGDAVIGNNTDNVLKVRRLNGKSATTNDADHLYINYDAAGKNVYIGPGSNVVWHAGNDGAGSGLDADLLDGVQLSAIYSETANSANTVRVYANTGSTVNDVYLNFINTASISVSVTAGTGTATGNANVAFSVISPVSGNYYRGVPVIDASGVMEIGRYIDFHSSATTTADYNVRITASDTDSALAVSGNVNSTNINASSSVRAPIFYDSGDLNYFVDPNSRSVLHSSNTLYSNVSIETRHTGNILDTPIVTTTTDATYGINAAGKVIVVDSTSARTITFATAPVAGFAVTVLRKNTGNVIISNTSTLLRLNTSNFTTLNISTQYGAATVIYTATNQIVLIGDIL